MDTFPYHAIDRAYALGTPQWEIADSGVDALRMRSGALDIRDRIGQPVYRVHLGLEALSAAEAAILWDFYADHRGSKFYWSDPRTGPFSSSQYATYTVIFDPSAPMSIVPGNAYDLYTAQIALLPILPTVSVDMLLAHWKMSDNAATTTVEDSSDNGYDLTAARNTDQITTTGKIGTALTFNGSSDYLTRSPTAFESECGSVCAWIKPATVSGAHVILAASDTATDTHIFRLAQVASTLNYYYSNGGTADNISTASGVITVSTWRHVIFTSDGSTIRLYVNGVAVALDTVTTGSNAGKWIADVDGLDNLTVGALSRTTTVEWFSGDIDDVRVYQRPLTLEEILAIYNSGTGTESEVVP